ncbi:MULTISPECIES: cysteine hydrolase family protein [Pseudomonas]|nr:MULTISPECIES: cysteine hydrolase family protein [Pseudomonas]MDN5405594.1 cysteine hydrolase [Pseudomonas sp.]MDN5447634.1 cysteine hydrolase [Pseudomonas sp.]MDN5453799.1 cysteine hydrolase [Pseudomonas sp.]MDN5457834.1 cysteine hydrolase [Pseudomonas sp.]MDN5496114.1 cysteine hydrolase [Pseudomonas sp.]
MPKLLSSLLACLSLAATSAIAAEPAVNPNPTIRAMSGAVPIDRLDPASTALLVIDFQQEYFTGRLPIPDGQKALNKARELIAFADKARIPVYQIQHIAPAGSAVFALDGEGVKFHPQMLPRAGDTVLQKTTVSVFGSTELDRLLKEKGIKTVIIAGLMTHACVAGGARDAAPLGYQVVVASDASATRSITRADGSSIDANSLHRAALASVEDTFGDVMTTAQIVKLPLK